MDFPAGIIALVTTKIIFKGVGKEIMFVIVKMKMNVDINKKKHGGKRINAGRKRLYTEETQTISFRVPKSLIEPITKYVKSELLKAKIK